MEERPPYTSKQARYVALKTINAWITVLYSQSGHVVPAFESNQYISKRNKRKIRKELENIRWQLINREIKLNEEIFGREENA